MEADTETGAADLPPPALEPSGSPDTRLVLYSGAVSVVDVIAGIVGAPVVLDVVAPPEQAVAVNVSATLGAGGSLLGVGLSYALEERQRFNEVERFSVASIVPLDGTAGFMWSRPESSVIGLWDEQSSALFSTACPAAPESRCLGFVDLAGEPPLETIDEDAVTLGTWSSPDPSTIVGRTSTGIVVMTGLPDGQVFRISGGSGTVEHFTADNQGVVWRRGTFPNELLHTALVDPLGRTTVLASGTIALVTPSPTSEGVAFGQNPDLAFGGPYSLAYVPLVDGSPGDGASFGDISPGGVAVSNNGDTILAVVGDNDDDGRVELRVVDLVDGVAQDLELQNADGLRETVACVGLQGWLTLLRTAGEWIGLAHVRVVEGEIIVVVQDVQSSLDTTVRCVETGVVLVSPDAELRFVPFLGDVAIGEVEVLGGEAGDVFVTEDRRGIINHRPASNELFLYDFFTREWVTLGSASSFDIISVAEPATPVHGVFGSRAHHIPEQYVPDPIDGATM